MEKPPDKDGRCAEEISWTWKRKPLQGYDHTIGLSYRRKILGDIKSVLTDVGGEKLVQQFVDGCFGHLLRFTRGVSCNKALHELIGREITLAGARDDELWFRIGETNIRFAPAEYALVTGLRFGSSSFDPLGIHEMPPKGVFNRLCSGHPISIRELWNLFNQRRLITSPEDYLKVAHILALNLMVLGYEQPKTVERWMWVLVDDLDSWNGFPWGAYTYQALMHYVSILPRMRASVRRRYHFYGPVWALQIWAYEAIPRLGKTSALVTRQVTVPRCLNWSFPSGYKKFPKQFLDWKLDCCVTLEPTDEEKLQPYWLSVQTEQPLGVRYASGLNWKQGLQGAVHPRGVATAASLSPQRPRLSSIHTPLVECSLGEPGNPVEVPDTDDSVLSTPKPSARPSRRRNRTRACICSSLLSGGRPRHVRRWPELLDEDRFADQVSSRVVDQMIKPMAEEVTRILIESMVKLLIPHLKQHIGDLFQAREVDDQLETENPGDNADCAKADEKKKEQSFDGGSSSMHNSRRTVDEPSPGLLKKPAPKDPRLDTGLASHGKSSANQEDSTMPNEESRLKRDGPVRAQSDSTEKAEIRPPRAGEADEPELLADPSSSKTKKKKSSRTSKRRRRSPSTNEETSDDEGSESSSGDKRLADPSLSKTKKKKKKSSSTRKRMRQSPSSNEETSDNEGSDSSSGDETRRKMKKRGKRKKRKCSESSSSENSDSDRHRRRSNKRKHRRASSSEPDARGSGRHHRHHHPRRHRSVSLSD